MTPALTHDTAGGAEQVGLFAATACPLCHTDAPAVALPGTQEDEGWTCATCGQTWNTARLERASAYAVYAAAHPVPTRHFADSIPRSSR